MGDQTWINKVNRKLADYDEHLRGLLDTPYKFAYEAINYLHNHFGHFELSDIPAYRGRMKCIQTHEGSRFERKPFPVNEQGVALDEPDGVMILRCDADPRCYWYRSPVAGHTVLADWFKHDRNTWTDALQNAINYVAPRELELVVSTGTYVLTRTLVKPNGYFGLNMRGISRGVTFEYSGIEPDEYGRRVCLKIPNTTGISELNHCYIRSIRFKGDSGTIGLQFNGAQGQRYTDCRFMDNLIGVQHLNGKGDFTEYCQGEDCDFNIECATPVSYEGDRGTGPDDRADFSFKGCGLKGTNYINTDGRGPVVLIGDYCLPYNAPFSAEIWTHPHPDQQPGEVIEYPVFKNLNGPGEYFTPVFFGNLTMEYYGGTVILGEGWNTLYVGNIIMNGGRIASGRVIPCQKALIDGNQTIPMGINYAIKRYLAPGRNEMRVPLPNSAYTVSVDLVGTNYTSRILYTLMHRGYGAVPWLRDEGLGIQAGPNQTVYGPPKIYTEVDGDEYIVIENGNYPATGEGRILAWLNYKSASDYPVGSAQGSIF
ncbi:hypothetical protein [Arsenicibacter rosenii]|uniref:Uncharacterized protein n=1 Tax=Arsenicibacter rosenii TaxID=1750698 RepID=A0A1S2VN45_9BACT|nr:hypothetical protein [Arsenicibacter rosenii]OIN59820.1 hypothetical protein BLX24_08150 [Arsenicibacter rosenii]